ncbi:MAG: leucyl aminopeptidase [Rhodospirillales bacterium]|nr:leucyl aminopeptidase [Rhodospirillales bacterium]
MTLSVTFHKSPRSRVDTVVVGVYADNRLSPGAAKLDGEHGGLLADFLAGQKKFTGKSGQSAFLTAATAGVVTRIVLWGLGDEEKLDGMACETLGGKLYPVLAEAGAGDSDFIAPGWDAAQAARFGLGLLLRSYKFDKYKKDTAEDNAPQGVALIGEAYSAAAQNYKMHAQIAEGVFFARDLVTEPANVLYPESYAERIKDELKPLGVTVDIFDEKKLQKLGFEAHMAVGQGSDHPPRLVVMRWNGGGAKGKKVPVALVGKGITFDTGGVNMKPTGEMLTIMKMDMGGSAAVVGAMKALALRKAKADVVGVVALAENMVSGNAIRPSDIIGSLSGKTIEVGNTDAEGRLVLADALTYVQKTYDPDVIIDVATLTGAVLMAMGNEYGGAFVNDDEMWVRLDKAGLETGDKLWRLPLHEVYREAMKGQIADLNNLGSMTPYGGTCTAAGFLELFIDEGRKWAHLDIAGSAWTKADRPTCPKTFTGFGVRVLDRFIADSYEA